MASSKEYLEYVLDLMSGLDDISYRAMMGEYVLYYKGKVFGGIYDDRFLVKSINAPVELMPDTEREIPYEGSKEMLLVDSDDRGFVKELIEDMYEELPAPKKKR